MNHGGTDRSNTECPSPVHSRDIKSLNNTFSYQHLNTLKCLILSHRVKMTEIKGDTTVYIPDTPWAMSLWVCNLQVPYVPWDIHSSPVMPESIKYLFFKAD